MSNRVLVVVDMQNDFIDGSLGTPQAREIVGRVVSKINERKGAGYTVLFTQDTHDEGYLETREGKYLPVAHCIEGTRGWMLDSQIGRAAVGCRIYKKGNFASLELLNDLERLQPSEVEFVGLCTDICVVSNALGARARLPEARVTVDKSCCAGVTPESHAAALSTMKSCQIDII